MSKVSLIGNGFVGKNLIDLYKHDISDVFTRKNIDTISNKEHEWIFCAAPSGKKWIANLNPTEDRSSCQQLVKHLLASEFERLFLFSTTDVYDHQASPSQNEDSEVYSAEPYGQNRRMIEVSLLESGKKVHILRLPALFGNHLEKNYIFDLIHGNNLDKIRIDSRFQWFNIANLDKYIVKSIEGEISVMNISVEPTPTETIVDLYFPERKTLLNGLEKGLTYDMRTKHSNNESGYHLNSNEVISQMGDFLNNVRHNN